MAAKRMGPPKKRASEKQARAFTVGLTGKQYRELGKIAKKHGRPVATVAATYIAAIVDGHAGKRLLAEIEKRLAKE